MSKDSAGLRKRKGQAKEKRQGSEGDELPGVEPTTSATLNALIYFLVFCAVGGVIYIASPELIKGLVLEFLGIEAEAEADYYSGASLVPNWWVADVEKRDAVVNAFKWAWHAYERDAMGDDEYHPISGKGTNLTSAGGIGYTVVDSIDTMLLMGEPLAEEYKRARSWVADKLQFDCDANFNTFETTIRVLGGLLTAYHLSGEDTMYIRKAVDLADRILPAFETPAGLPMSLINLAQRRGSLDKDNYNLISTAEAATLQLEFKDLAELTGNEVYWEKVENVMRVIKKARMPAGLASIFLSPNDGQFVQSAIRLGSRGDSYYEYLLKQWLQTNQTEDVYREAGPQLGMYDDAMNAIHNHLIQKSITGNFIYTAELIPERSGPGGEVSWRLTPKQDHLACFIGGSLMLGAVTSGALISPVSIPPKMSELTDQGKRDWKSGVELVRTCWNTHDTATGLAPEIVHFRIKSDGMDQMMGSTAPHDWYIKGARRGEFPPYDARYMLRPETVESLFLAYRLTGDARYREWGWSIFRSIEKHCKVETGGYATVVNVDEVPVRLEDKMETFLMSETLKYLYLLFADEEILPLSQYVLNTEAHPLPIFTPNIHTGFS
ncbi:glycoside hydrolase [Punctularia strigosozonata HHB-11173 SS5]|uniref:glycoside hydrolase n=1 Tax=Punctularia strigosozonata (strain HHB-11173) TaxID=741275 RepID=UPI0004416F2E|nr:glycoside hydrolase [Punctularia strigosozonata HHB-11173 SS5]EIN14259.1 glycoside hydrolase [Punctularia strigosozonata HHB-11173 SS5]